MRRNLLTKAPDVVVCRCSVSCDQHRRYLCYISKIVTPEQCQLLDCNLSLLFCVLPLQFVVFIEGNFNPFITQTKALRIKESSL